MKGAFAYEGGQERTGDRAAIDRPERAGHPVFADWAEVLLSNGYEPLPILPGQKRPALNRWSQVTIDAERIGDWERRLPDCGIGFRTGSLVGLDIDLLDPDVAHEIQNLAMRRFGETLVRVGNWPKRLLLYRAEESFRKAKAGKVEVLGAGQQFVAYGQHPETGAGYYWPGGEGPVEVPISDLPPVTEAEMHTFLAEAAALQPDHVVRSGSRRTRSARGGAHPTRDSDGRVVDGRDAWLSSIAFHALHDALDAGEAPDVATLTARVWTRFSETTELSRPRKDGGRTYCQHDARAKVQNKLRLQDRGSLPSRETTPVVPNYAPAGMSVEKSRERLDATLAAFCDQVLDWHAGDIDAAPTRAIKATVGLGKSRASRRHLMRLAADLRDRQLPHRILVFAATHALAEEAATDWAAQGARVAVLRGYERKDPVTGEPMCRDREAVAAAHASSLSAQEIVCKTRSGAQCRFLPRCLKQRNRRDVAEADVVLAPYDALFTGFAFEQDDIALIVVDEACWPRAMDESRDICVEDFGEEPALDMSVARGPAGAMADLHAFRQAATSGLVTGGVGPVRRAALTAAGLTAEDCRAAARLERRRLANPGLRPDLQGAARATAFRRAHRNARIEGLARIWKELAELLDGATERSGRLRVLPPDSSGRHPLQFRRVKPLHESLRNRPVLHLDATFRGDLAGTVLRGLAPVTIEAAAPHMHLRLVTGSFGKSMLCPETGLAPEETRRRQNRVQDCLDYVRWHALRHAPGRVLVVTYKAIEAAFAGIENVETAHFNAVAGLDVYKDVAALITIGRPLPASTELEALCGGYFGSVPSGGYGSARAGIHMANGQTRTVRTIRHGDENAEVLRRAICDDELIQAIGRGRGVNRTAGNPLEVHVLADVALPLVHDRVLTWDVERPDIFQQMLISGIATDSPADAAVLHPELFGSANEAKKQFQQGVFRGQTPMNHTYREMTLKSAAYRKPGRGRGWQRFWWVGSTSGLVVQRWLEVQLAISLCWRDRE